MIHSHSIASLSFLIFFFFFFNDTATTEIYTLSLHDALPISTPRRRPSNNLAVSVVSPRILPRVTASPSAIPSVAASAGCIITVGAPSRASDDGVSLKLELRKLRDGLVASRNGCAWSASSMMVQWSGSDGIFSQGPIPAMPQGGCAQSALKWNFLSACAKPL